MPLSYVDPAFDVSPINIADLNDDSSLFFQTSVTNHCLERSFSDYGVQRATTIKFLLTSATTTSTRAMDVL
jgi:hypothetical protein